MSTPSIAALVSALILVVIGFTLKNKADQIFLFVIVVCFVAAVIGWNELLKPAGLGGGL
ncbi:hypothetical protein [Marinomonas sp. CT5]|uniref:hypothetical protein n=1 Tax=Marinomonas sp. CT5 TaxID=2066133 RepID=UPI001BAEBB22|nr:hypothetical protein [Marinomonas sp. CT5]